MSFLIACKKSERINTHEVVNYPINTEGWNYLRGNYDLDGILLAMKSFYSKIANCLWKVKMLELNRKKNLKVKCYKEIGLNLCVL